VVSNWAASFALLLVSLQPLPLLAAPPFVYASALGWLQDTVHSEIPAGDRVYVLGPDRTKEFHALNKGVATHDLETRLVVSAHDYRTLADLLSDLPLKDRKLEVIVWRAGHQHDEIDQPVFGEILGEALMAPFHLQPDDIVELKDLPVGGAVTI
jgi:hypothetical protein